MMVTIFNHIITMKSGYPRQVTSFLLLMLIVQALVSCSVPNGMSVKKSHESKVAMKLPDSLENKQKKGFEFYASGDMPVAWTLDMDIDHGYYFKATDGINMTIVPVKPKGEDGQLKTYTARNTQGEMRIDIFPEGCDGSTASKHKVAVTVNNTRYSGCGTDLYDVAIDDTWIMEKVGTTLLNAKDFSKGLPQIALRLSENKLMGTDGCNNMTAAFSMLGSRIQFSTVNFSGNACSASIVRKVLEDKLSKHLVDYYFKNGKLYFYLVDDSLIIFRKKG